MALAKTAKNIHKVKPKSKPTVAHMSAFWLWTWYTA